MASGSQIGLETRSKILPSDTPKGMDFLGPNYNYADEIFRPKAIGVQRGDTFSSVTNAIKGMAYYMDTIAFGQSSNFMTRGMPFKKYGVNYFLKTGATCSNGADMYQYIELIPKGDAFGKNIGKAISEMGATELRGLAPGIVEDAKAAMNPAPLLGALMGSGYPRCKLELKPVGDEMGYVRSVETGENWVEDPTTLVECGQGPDGKWYTSNQPYTEIDPTRPVLGKRACQTKWIADVMISKEDWDADKKTLNPDGTTASQTTAAQTTASQTTEGFEPDNNRVLVSILATLIVANIWALSQRR